VTVGDRMSLLGRVLKIRSGEGRTTGLGVAMMVFTAGGSAFGQSGTDGLFFAHAGPDRLPVMLLIAGGLMFVTSIIVTALLGVVPRQRLFLVLPLIAAASLLIERALLAAAASWIYPVLWLSASIVVLIQWLFTWGLLGIVVNTRQAKRLFPLFGAGAILGVVIGGLLTGPLAALVGAEDLLFVWAACLTAASLAGRALVGRGRAAEVTVRRSRRPKTRPFDEMLQGFRFVRGSSVMKWMSLAAILFSALFFSLYLPFSRAATDRFPSADELAGFFGLFSAVTTAAALLTSLFLTNRMITRFGVTTVLLMLALIYLGGFGVLIASGTFATIVVVRFIQMLWSQAVANPAWEAVINIVPPIRRDQTRAFLNGGPTQVGTAIAGLIQLIGLRRLSAIQLYSIGLGTAVLTSFAMWQVRRAYSNALMDALRSGRPQVFPSVADDEAFNGRQVDAAAVAAVLGGASDEDVRVRRAAIEILSDLPDREAADALRAAVRDPDTTVRASALRSLARAGDTEALPVVFGALADPDPEARLAAIRAVAVLTGGAADASEPIRGLLADPDPAVRAAAASAIVVGPARGEALLVLRAMLESEHPRARELALRAAGSPETFDLAAAGLRDADPRVRTAAAEALDTSDPARAISLLVRTLGDDDDGVKAAAAHALDRIGAPSTEPVLAALFDPELAQGALLALEHLSVGSAHEVVRGYAREEAARAVADFDTSRAIDPADDDDRLLLDSLMARARTQALHAFRAVALLRAGPSIRFAIDNLSSRDPEQVANALEALDSLGEHTIVRPLLRLWESVDRRSAPRDEWLPRLLRDPDPWIRDCAALLSGPTRKDLTMTDALATMSDVERVLFLRKVPLFAGLAPQDLKHVAAVADERAFVDDETIAGQGEPGDELHIVVDGEVRVLWMDPDAGSESELARRSQGDVVGEMALITQEPRMASLVAAGEVRTLRLGRKEFEGVLRERPDTALAVIRVLSQRLVESASRSG
jgi:HEAT repeat protein